MPKRAKAEQELPPFDLKASREAKGLNQAKTAEILCASQGSVARWENDGNTPLIYRRYWALYWDHSDRRKPKVQIKSKHSKSKTKVVARTRPNVDTTKTAAT